MLSHVIPQCLVTDRITIKLQLTGKSRLFFDCFFMSAGQTAMLILLYLPPEGIANVNLPSVIHGNSK